MNTVTDVEYDVLINPRAQTMHVDASVAFLLSLVLLSLHEKVSGHVA